ncbi:MAG: RNA methyltransferase, partial [bacterium]|nr:RNA methyltransferase [bacterium]
MTPDLATLTVCLVRPRIPENVGFVARSMKTMGFSRLLLADPAFSLQPESPAFKTASGAQDILHQCQIHRHLETALAPFHHVLGFSRRQHNFERPQSDLGPWLQQHSHILGHQHIALVFGPEDYGLSTPDKRLCKQILTIPMKAETMSLNLSHAVTIVLYAISQALTESPASPAPERPVSHENVQRVVNQLITMLEPTTFFKAGRKEYQAEAIRNLIQRLELSEGEY